MFWLIITHPAVLLDHRFLWPILRILAWPPSRARYDAIVKGNR
jgi:hypothetical protein